MSYAPTSYCTVALEKRTKKEIPDILWYMLILFDKITMDEDLERALVPILFCCSKLQQTYDGSQSSQPSAPVWHFPGSLP